MNIKTMTRMCYDDFYKDLSRESLFSFMPLVFNGFSIECIIKSIIAQIQKFKHTHSHIQNGDTDTNEDEKNSCCC